MDIQTITAAQLTDAIRSGAGLLAFRLRKHPEQARVFRKYGTPEQTAERIRTGSSDIFFDNGTTVMTNDYLLSREAPETFVMLADVLAVYPEMRSKGEYLVVHDRWGDEFRYPFAVGQKQVFRIGILIDKIKKAAPGCRTGHRPEDLEYARQHTEPLPAEHN